jgi:glutaredoxin
MMNDKKLFIIVLVALIVFSGCNQSDDKDIEDKAKEKENVASVDDIPIPVVGDASSNLLYSYVGKTGQMVSVGTLNDVPQKARERVLVVDLSRTPQERMAHRYAFFVDLTQSNADGNYPVSVVSRYQSAKGEGPPAGLMPSSTADIVVYSAVWCGFCHKLERWLKERGTPFQKKDVEKDPGADRELKAKLAQAGITSGGVPVTDVAGTMVVGFNKSKLKTLIENWEKNAKLDAKAPPEKENEKKK